MKPITTFSEARSALRPLYNNARTKYDLNVMRALMEYLGNPQDSLRVIHIAGTSGKTSTAYYVAALLKASGHRVGLTVSPHVDEINERVQIGLVPLPEDEFCHELTMFMDLVRRSTQAPSYFEAMVAFAYWLFAKKNVDYAVVEVGLGGLLDGTNVVNRKDKVCVITDIGLDHTEILGDTVPQVAAQKAGIIQSGNTVFMYDQGLDITGVVRKRCEEQTASLRIVPTTVQYKNAKLPLFQQRNFGLAVQVANFVEQRDHAKPVSAERVFRAAETKVPARMEILKVGGKVLIVDGSHNAQKLGTLSKSISARYPMQKVAVLCAFVEGPATRWQGGVDALLGLAERIIITTFQVEQDVPKKSINPRMVAKYIETQSHSNVICEPNAKAALQLLLAAPEPLLLVAGSFYLLNNVRPLIIDTND